MDKSHIELQILQLAELQNICNQIKDIENFKQSDTELEKLLKGQYSLTKDEISEITSMVEGKKKDESSNEGELDSLKKKFDSYCLICEVNSNKKDGSFVGYSQLNTKCSNKKSVLKKKIKEMEEKGE